MSIKTIYNCSLHKHQAYKNVKPEDEALKIKRLSKAATVS